MIPGIDVSKWQGQIDWPKVAADGYKFAIVKVSEGSWSDACGARNVAAARAAGLAVGAYHYLRHDVPAWQQAKTLAAESHGCLLLALDVERPGEERLAADLAEGVAARLRSLVPDARIVVYGSPSYLTNAGLISGTDSTIGARVACPELAEADLWIAWYRTDPPEQPPTYAGHRLLWDRWRIWQRTGTGSAAGIKGDVDLDLFDGDEGELKAFFAGLPEPQGQPSVSSGLPIQPGEAIDPRQPRDPARAAHDT